MSIPSQIDDVDGAVSATLGTVDDKGRISLSKAVRGALGIHAGSTLALVIVNGALLVIPQDEHLAELMQRATDALTASGLSVQDLLDELPAARAEVMSEAYSAEFLEELARLQAEYAAREGQ